MDPNVKREIEAAVREEKDRFGVPGVIVLVDRQLELHAGGAPVSIDLDVLVEQWPLLPPDMQRRKAAEATRRLVEAYRAASGSRSRRGGRRSRLIAIPTGALALAVVAVGATIWFFVSGGVTPVPTTPDAGAHSETDTEAKARWGRVCEATRRRLYAGATIGPFDDEGTLNGWVVELWLAHSKGDLKTDPTAGGLIEGGKLTKAADDQLAQLTDASVDIGDGFPPNDARKSPMWKAEAIRFHGKYVGAFFNPEARPRLLAAADRLADAANAEFAALYGRCAHLTVHDLGAWFRGPDAGGAALSLVYAMGFFSEMPAVERGSLSALGELDSLRKASIKIDDGTLAGLVSASSGGVSSAGTSTSVTFPIGRATRATDASRSIARKIGVGAGTE